MQSHENINVLGAFHRLMAMIDAPIIVNTKPNKDHPSTFTGLKCAGAHLDNRAATKKTPTLATLAIATGKPGLGAPATALKSSMLAPAPKTRPTKTIATTIIVEGMITLSDDPPKNTEDTITPKKYQTKKISGFTW